jgi:hypothetical protein
MDNQYKTSELIEFLYNMKEDIEGGIGNLGKEAILKYNEIKSRLKELDIIKEGLKRSHGEEKK